MSLARGEAPDGIKGRITPAVDEVTHLSGRIVNASGNPIRNALVEIWQVDNHGVYLHEGRDGQHRVQ
jgi:protocatechuate 3,4-dioxygenase beta subunit